MRHCVTRIAICLAGAALAAPLSAATTVQAEVVGPASAPVEDAVVFLIPLSGQKVGRPAVPATIAQQDREFVPYVTAVQAGASVRFPNRDPIRHHVYSFSPARKFEIKLYAGDAPDPIVFDKPGVVTLGCNVHDWMLGYVLVVDTPWFARTGADGRAQIEAVDDGQYEAHVWHPRQRSEAAPQRLTVAATAAGALRFTIEVAPRKPHYKPPLDPLHYTR